MEQFTSYENQVNLEQNQPKKKSYLIPLFLLIFLLITLPLSVFFISRRTSYFGQAYGPNIPSSGVAELENSYMFASPLVAKADGQEKIRINIFILDSTGKGVSGEAVFLGQDDRLVITSVQAVTDNLGRVIFDVSSTSAADYLIESRVGNRVLPQRVKISFR